MVFSLSLIKSSKCVLFRFVKIEKRFTLNEKSAIDEKMTLKSFLVVSYKKSINHNLFTNMYACVYCNSFES